MTTGCTALHTCTCTPFLQAADKQVTQCHLGSVSCKRCIWIGLLLYHHAAACPLPAPPPAPQVDAHLCTEAPKYLAALLLSLSSMLHLELPAVNVLSKVDLLRQYGGLGGWRCWRGLGLGLGATAAGPSAAGAGAAVLRCACSYG